MAKTPVLFSHDGGVDDYLCILLLATMEDIDLIGIVVTPADCYLEPAVNASRKILDFMGRSDVPVGASTVRGLNPFPRSFRKSSYQLDNFPILNTKDTMDAPLAEETGQEFVARLLGDAPEPVVFLETGPLTTLAEALKIDPSIESKVDYIPWMGGALNVPGNVSPYIDPATDGSPEWNVFWDPIAAHEIWQTSIAVTMCPLDITNNVPLTTEFQQQLGRQHKYPVSDLAGQCYALVRHQPYYFWDVLTTAYLSRSDLFTVREWETEIIPTGMSQGRTKVVEGGRKVTAMDTVDVDGFYNYILEAWKR